MNYTRIALAGLGATLSYLAVGFLLFAILPLDEEVSRFAAVYRPPESMEAAAPVGLAGLLLSELALAALYTLTDRGGSSLARGLRFGLLVGLVASGSFVLHNYVSLNIGLRLALLQALACFVQWVASGVVIALIYRPRKP